MFTSLTSSKVGRIHLAGAVVAAAGLLAGVAQGQPDGAGNDYCVIHSFDLQTQGNLPPLVQMVYSTHVRARTNNCQDLVPGPKDNSGIDAAAPFTQSANSTAPDSTGTANSIATIATIAAGRVTGSFEASGKGTPALTGCPDPAPLRSSGSVQVWSSTKVQAKGQKLDRRGRIKAAGGWRSTETIRGKKYKSVARDPIVARLIDHTTGITLEYELLSIKSVVGGGSGAFEWNGAVLSNSAPDLDFTVTMSSPVTIQQGTINLQVRNGVVTRSIATGVFATVEIPAVGGLGAFAAPLGEITMDFDLGGDDTHDLAAEFDFDNAGEVEKVIASDGTVCIGGCVLSDLGTGPDGANVSEISLPDTTMGFNCAMPLGRCAQLIDVPVQPNVPIELVAMSLTSYGAPPAAAFVRIWQGFPGQGSPIAGDLTTNHLMDVQSTGAYRVPGHNPHDASRPLSETYIDLRWVPPLPPQGQYWIEFATRAQVPSAQTFAIQSPWEVEQMASMEFVSQLNQWRPTMDQGSGRLVNLATKIFVAPAQTTPACYADCDGVGGLTANDFQCFMNAFVSGASYANCDGVGGLTANDFQCFLDRAAAGCS